MKDFLSVPQYTLEEMVAARCLAMNLPMHRVASISGVVSDRIKQLLQEQNFLEIVAEMRTDLVVGRDPVRQTIRTLAEDKILEILSSNYREVGTREKAIIAKVALSVLSEQEKEQVETNNIVNNVLVTEDALGVLARHLAQIGEKQKISDIEKKVPLRKLSEMYACAPDTERGVLNYDSDTGEYQCHICGVWAEDFERHIDSHNITIEEYEEIFEVKIDGDKKDGYKS
jgi:hypothetical protein